MLEASGQQQAQIAYPFKVYGSTAGRAPHMIQDRPSVGVVIPLLSSSCHLLEYIVLELDAAGTSAGLACVSRSLNILISSKSLCAETMELPASITSCISVRSTTSLSLGCAVGS